MSTQQPQQIPIAPMIFIAGVWFAPQAIIAVDPRDYLPGETDRIVMLHLASGGTIEFENEEADAIKLWWDRLTGQSRIEAPPPGLKLS